MQMQMTVKDAMAFLIDYGKFIAAMWSTYIVMVVAVIGWLVTLRSKDLPLDPFARKTLVATYLGATFIFGFVLYYNHQYLLQLHEMLKVLATSTKDDAASAAYLATFGKAEIANVLNGTLGALVVIALLVSVFMWFITKSAGAQAKGHATGA